MWSRLDWRRVHQSVPQGPQSTGPKSHALPTPVQLRHEISASLGPDTGCSLVEKVIARPARPVSAYTAEANADTRTPYARLRLILSMTRD